MIYVESSRHVNERIQTQVHNPLTATLLEAPLITAQEVLLEPYALNDQRLQTVFGQIMSHRVDYADLYFQYSRSESWSL